MRTPEQELRLMNLQGYSPDFTADECHLGLGERGRHCRIQRLGTKALVQERVRELPWKALASRRD